MIAARCIAAFPHVPLVHFYAHPGVRDWLLGNSVQLTRREMGEQWTFADGSKLTTSPNGVIASIIRSKAT